MKLALSCVVEDKGLFLCLWEGAGSFVGSVFCVLREGWKVFFGKHPSPVLGPTGSRF